MDQAEHRLSFCVAALLDRVMVGEWWATAVDHSGAAIGRTEQAQMAWRQRQKAMGIKPAHLDWYCFQRDTGVFAQFELKSGYNKPTEGQETTMRLLRERNIPTGCAWTLREFFDLLVSAGFKLHLNAANILSEVEARHAALDRQAAAVKSGEIKKKRRAPKDVEAKPTAARLRKVAAIRASGVRF